MKRIFLLLLFCLLLVSCKKTSNFDNYFEKERCLSVIFSDSLGEIEGVLRVDDSIYFYPDNIEGLEIEILQDSVVTKFDGISFDTARFSRLSPLYTIKESKLEGSGVPSRILGENFEIKIKEELSVN